MSSSPVQPGSTVQPSTSHSSVKLSDDVASLTSFNPFSEEDDNDKSSYTLVTSIFSRMKNTLSAPLASTTPAVPSTAAANAPAPQNSTDQRRLSHPGQIHISAPTSKTPGSERPNPLHPAFASAAPPLVSLTPAQSEVLSYNAEHERSPSRAGAFYSPVWDSSEGALFGTSIPGFPIPDDARSIRTSASLHRSASVSKVIRRIRGEGEPLLLIHVDFLMALQGYHDTTGWKMRIAKNAMTVKANLPLGDENTIAEYVVSNAQRMEYGSNDWNRPDILFAMRLKCYQRFSFRAGRNGPRL